MNFFSRHPMLVLAIGILGVSASAILVKYSQAPSVITAVYRLGWTVLLMLPMTFGTGNTGRSLPPSPESFWRSARPAASSWPSTS